MIHYENVLDYYNILIRDEIIEFIRNSKVNDSYLFSLLSILDEFEIIDKNELFRNDSIVFLFCLTKNYLDSDLFKYNFKEAKETGEQILIIFLENDLDLNCGFKSVFKIIPTFHKRSTKTGKSEVLKLNSQFLELHDALSRILNRKIIVNI